MLLQLEGPAELAYLPIVYGLDWSCWVAGPWCGRARCDYWRPEKASVALLLAENARHE